MQLRCTKNDNAPALRSDPRSTGKARSCPAAQTSTRAADRVRVAQKKKKKMGGRSPQHVKSRVGGEGCVLLRSTNTRRHNIKGYGAPGRLSWRRRRRRRAILAMTEFYSQSLRPLCSKHKGAPSTIGFFTIYPSQLWRRT